MSKFKHGFADKHRLYSTWKSMRSRCNNPNSGNYKYYGGKGIKVCSRWDDFRNFLEDMEETFEEGLTLDRIDTKGNYEPTNTRWATKKEQSCNNSRKVTYLYKGQEVNESDFSRLIGVPRTTLQSARKRGKKFEGYD